MSRRKNDKKTTYLEPIFSDILVCKDRSLKSQIEIIVQKPENISQEGLGILFGIFEIVDESEDSLYIINYLLSIIKKEYFSKPKRGAIESLEASLKKANLALSKIAEQGNINWIGNFNAACAVFEKGNFHFSKTGEATILLLRSQALTEISRNMTPADEANPLKTFVDMVSGKLEESDKIIMATDGIFDIFSPEEIKRSALKFTREEFIQFLQTALINELPRAAVLVADIEQKEVEELVYIPPQKEINAFSQNTFKKKNRPEAVQKQETVDQEIKEVLQQKADGFVDKKGHIYIREDMCHYKEKREFGEFFSVFQEKIIVIAKTIKPSGLFYFLGYPVRKWRGRKTPAEQKESSEEILKEIKEGSMEPKNYDSRPKKEILKKSLLIISALWGEIKVILKILISKTLQLVFKLRYFWHKMNRQQKIYTILIILAIFSFVWIIFSSEEPAPPVQPETISEVAPPAPDYSILRGDAKEITNWTEIYSSPNGEIRRVSIAKDKVVIVKNKEVINIESQEPFALPDNFHNPELVAGMDDLQMFFLLNNSNQLTSFSPVSKKFQDNVLNVPEGSEIKTIGTYLTYLYVVDEKNNQIYRYPRAAGGFGDKTDWLKDSADLSNASGIAISENLYITDGRQIQKFFRGKKEDFSIKNTDKTIIPSQIYAIGGSENLFVLDKENMLVLKLDKDGNILAKFFSPETKDVLSFAVSEQENKVAIGTENKVLVGNLE